MGTAILSVFWHGLLSGWTVCLFLDRFGIIAFGPPGQNPEIPNYCTQNGYPKEQDFFWAFAFVTVSIVMPFICVSLWRRLRRSALLDRLPDLHIWPAFACLAVAFMLFFSTKWSTSPLTMVLGALGILFPWGSSRWYREDVAEPVGEADRESPISVWLWAAFSLGLAALWLYDPCLSARDIDPLHEGVHLLYVQSYLAGDMQSGGVRAEYGALYLRSVAWWMSICGMHVRSLRWYFLLAQVSGLTLCLIAVRLFCRTRWCVAAGVWLLLTSSTASYGLHPYGWANLLRIALPLISIALCWVGMKEGNHGLTAASAIMAGMATLYSPELGIAGVVACGVLLLFVGEVRHARSWTIVLFASVVILWVAMYGGSSVQAVLHSAGGGYVRDRLMGHGVRPFPEFRWWLGAGHLNASLYALIWTASVWGPLLLSSSVIGFSLSGRGVRQGRQSLVIALAVFAALAQIPALARPLGQQTLSVPAWVALGAAVLGSPSPRVVILTIILAAGYGLKAPFAGLPSAVGRWTCRAEPNLVETPRESRFGGIKISSSAARFYAEIVPVIQKYCPQYGRFYLAAPFEQELCFLANRTALPPYPSSVVAASPHERMVLVGALQAVRPLLVVVSVRSLEIPYSVAHPEPWAFIQEHYRCLKQVGTLQIFTPRHAR